jgi:hypothetical protein
MKERLTPAEAALTQPQQFSYDENTSMEDKDQAISRPEQSRKREETPVNRFQPVAAAALEKPVGESSLSELGSLFHEVLSNVTAENRLKLIDAMGKIEERNRRGIIEGLRSLSKDAETLQKEAVEQGGVLSVNQAKKELETITEDPQTAGAKINRYISPGGTLHNAYNLLSHQLSKEELEQLGLDNYEAFEEDVRKSLSQGDTAQAGEKARNMLSQIREHMPPPVMRREEEGDDGETVEGLASPERNQRVDNIQQIAQAIMVNNPEFGFGPDGKYPLLDRVWEKNENGDDIVGKQLVHTRVVERKGRNGHIEREKVSEPIFRFRQDNFLRWVRDRLSYYHDQDPDQPQINFFQQVNIEVPWLYRTISVGTMNNDPGRYYKDIEHEFISRQNYNSMTELEKRGCTIIEERDDGKNLWIRRETVLDPLKDEVTREVWLYGATRSMDITYNFSMPLDDKIGDVLMQMYQNNVLTKDSFGGKSPLYWILTSPENFNPDPSKRDARVGDITRTALLTYYNMTDYPELIRMYGRDSSLFSKKMIQEVAEELAMAEGLPRGNLYVKDEVWKNINSCFDADGRLKFDDKDAMLRFVSFLSVFNPSKNARELKLAKGLIKRALVDRYGLYLKPKEEGEEAELYDELGNRRYDTASLNFAEQRASFLSHFTLLGGRNDAGSMDASTKILKNSRYLSTRFDEDNSGVGNPHAAGLINAWTTDMLEGIHTENEAFDDINIRQNQVSIKNIEGKERGLREKEEVIELLPGEEVVGGKIERNLPEPLADREKIVSVLENGVYHRKIFKITDNGEDELVRELGDDERAVNLPGGGVGIRKDYWGKAVEEAGQSRKVVVSTENPDVVIDEVQDVLIQFKQGVYRLNSKENITWKGQNGQEKLVFRMRRGSKETILDVLHNLDALEKRKDMYKNSKGEFDQGRFEQDKLEIASHLVFATNSMRNFSTNSIGRAFNMFHQLEGLEELDIPSFFHYDEIKKRDVFDQDKLQQAVSEKIVKQLRYMYTTTGDWDMAKIVRAPDPYTENPYSTFADMHLAEAFFGRQIINTFIPPGSKSRDDIDWSFFNTSEGKIALWKTFMVEWVAAQVYYHMNKENFTPSYAAAAKLAIRGALESLPAKMRPDAEDFRKNEITKEFFGERQIGTFRKMNDDGSIEEMPIYGDSYMQVYDKASGAGVGATLRTEGKKNLRESLFPTIFGTLGVFFKAVFSG